MEITEQILSLNACEHTKALNHKELIEREVINP